MHGLVKRVSMVNDIEGEKLFSFVSATKTFQTVLEI